MERPTLIETPLPGATYSHIGLHFHAGRGFATASSSHKAPCAQCVISAHEWFGIGCVLPLPLRLIQRAPRGELYKSMDAKKGWNGGVASSLQMPVVALSRTSAALGSKLSQTTRRVESSTRPGALYKRWLYARCSCKLRKGDPVVACGVIAPKELNGSNDQLVYCMLSSRILPVTKDPEASISHDPHMMHFLKRLEWLKKAHEGVARQSARQSEG